MDNEHLSMVQILARLTNQEIADIRGKERAREFYDPTVQPVARIQVLIGGNNVEILRRNSVSKIRIVFLSDDEGFHCSVRANRIDDGAGIAVLSHSILVAGNDLPGPRPP